MLKTDKDIGIKIPSSSGRRSIRLKNKDYSLPGSYFVTVCANRMECVFGIMKDQSIQLSAIGAIVQAGWTSIPNHFANVKLHEYVTMPNHLHGIIEITFPSINTNDKLKTSTPVIVWVQHAEPIQEQYHIHQYQHTIPGSLGAMVRSFKSAVSKKCHENGFSFKWQRNFFDRIIRDQDELIQTREYILNNPVRWLTDDEYRTRNEKNL